MSLGYFVCLPLEDTILSFICKNQALRIVSHVFNSGRDQIWRAVTFCLRLIIMKSFEVEISDQFHWSVLLWDDHYWLRATGVSFCIGALCTLTGNLQHGFHFMGEETGAQEVIELPEYHTIAQRLNQTMILDPDQDPSQTVILDQDGWVKKGQISIDSTSWFPDPRRVHLASSWWWGVKRSWARQRLMPVIPATWEAEIGRIDVQGQPRQKVQHFNSQNAGQGGKCKSS
jgi:hypothetical protein